VPDRSVRRTPGRHTQHWRSQRRRYLLLAGATAATLRAVVGAGLLAGLSDDDPAGIATYSIPAPSTATRTITAIAVMQLWERVLVDLDAPAAELRSQGGFGV
jgi:CubicO group peptidase (beta-lactamase class C family)